MTATRDGTSSEPSHTLPKSSLVTNSMCPPPGTVCAPLLEIRCSPSLPFRDSAPADAKPHGQPPTGAVHYRCNYKLCILPMQHVCPFKGSLPTSRPSLVLSLCLPVSLSVSLSHDPTPRQQTHLNKSLTCYLLCGAISLQQELAQICQGTLPLNPNTDSVNKS